VTGVHSPASFLRPELGTASAAPSPELLPRELWLALVRSRMLPGHLALDGEKLAYRMAVRIRIQGSHALRALLGRIRGIIDKSAVSSQIVVTGLVPLLLESDRRIVRTQIVSMSLALLFTVICLGAITMRLRLGLAVVATSLSPVVFVLGMMGWTGVPLDVSTTMIASVSLGLIVDDTLHFLYRYRQPLRGRSEAVRMADLIASLGYTLTTTSLVIAGAFLILTISDFLPISRFGLLTAVTVMVALLAVLMLLPSIMLMSRDRR
jgi:predicted RND superfamily exporter protein